MHGCRRVFAAACAVAYLSVYVLRCVTGCLVGGKICVHTCGCIVFMGALVCERVSLVHVCACVCVRVFAYFVCVFVRACSVRMSGHVADACLYVCQVCGCAGVVYVGLAEHAMSTVDALCSICSTVC